MTIARIAQDDMPLRIAQLPRNRAGYPVPWFVTWINGEPDFRIITVEKIRAAIHFGICWICGEGLSGRPTFVIGPMCAVNRTSGEPPSHRQCAIYAAVHCPFLTIPKMQRREKGKPDGSFMHSGGLTRNPGVALVWVARPPIEAFRTEGTYLFNVGEPAEVLWFAEGREATRDEVLASIDSGLPALKAIAWEEGPDAAAELGRIHQAALALLPMGKYDRHRDPTTGRYVCFACDAYEGETATGLGQHIWHKHSSVVGGTTTGSDSGQFSGSIADDAHAMAVVLGRRGGLRGGPARARSLSPERRSEIARKAAAARWRRRDVSKEPPPGEVNVRVNINLPTAELEKLRPARLSAVLGGVASVVTAAHMSPSNLGSKDG